MTLFGIIYFAALFGILIFGRRLLPWLLAISAALPNTAVIVVSGNGISAFWMTGVILGFVVLYRMFKGDLRGRMIPEVYMLIFFALYAVFISLVGPFWFEGMPVVSPRGGVADQLESLTPLEFSVSNIAQSIYIIIGLGIVLFFISRDKINLKLLDATIWAGLIVTMLVWIFRELGSTVLLDILSNMPNISYQRGARLRGAFAEPSVLGAFLTAAIAYMLVAFFLRKGLAKILALLSILLAFFLFVESSTATAIIALALTLGIVAVFALFKGYQNNHKFLGTLLLCLPYLALIFIVFWEQISEVTLDLLADKVGSVSYTSRSGADSVGLDIFFETSGIGVGFGSNRPSSFLVLMLSSGGVIGFILFFGAIILAIINALKLGSIAAPTVSALVGILIANSIAKADLPTPMLWLCIALVMQMSLRRKMLELTTVSTKQRITSIQNLVS